MYVHSYIRNLRVESWYISPAYDTRQVEANDQIKIDLKP